MKRQENPLSSSSTRETRSENNQVKSMGCVSGIFQLLCKFQQRRRKFLTSSTARKQHKMRVVYSPTKPKPSPQQNNEAPQDITSAGDGKQEDRVIPSLGKASPSSSSSHCDFQRFSCDVPRSPALPAEIRTSNSVNLRRHPHALVARLMGLDDINPECEAEKRRKLLGALQKCDQDLKALKKIIEAIRSADNLSSPLVAGTGSNSSGSAGVKSPAAMKQWPESIVKVSGASCEHGVLVHKDDREKRCWVFNGEQPSPVSVLDISSSPLRCHFKGEHNKKLREDNISFFLHRITVESLPRLYSHRGYYRSEYFGSPTKNIDQELPFWRSKAMIESVNEVSQDVEWGERRELRRIGLVLQDDIFTELIEEIVRELGCCCLYSSLPFELCRRRLYF